MIEGRQAGQSSIAKLAGGMVGGGPGSFIGAVHRSAASFDGNAEYVAGAFSRSYEKSIKTGRQLGISEDRVYDDFEKMAKAESAREDGIDFVSIVVPNKLHYPVAKVFLEQGINVICDKPLTFTVEQAEELEELTEKEDLLFGVTYVYSGYPMVKHGREIVQRGDIGEIRVVQGEYPQEWLARPVEKEGNKQAGWRTDPEFSGRSNCVGDIGSHIENTVSYVTGLRLKELSANLDVFGECRQLDDNAAMLLKFEGGATGSYWCSQVAIGHDNGLKIRVYGTKGSLIWKQEDPDHLEVNYLGKPGTVLSRGRDELFSSAEETVRLPAGHPEGFYEAFANIYRNFLAALGEKKSGSDVDPEDFDYPSVHAGVQGVKFINACVDSSESGSEWVKLD